jgi:hypothetical protein
MGDDPKIPTKMFSGLVSPQHPSIRAHRKLPLCLSKTEEICYGFIRREGNPRMVRKKMEEKR